MRKLICATVVRIGQKQIFSWRGSIHWPSNCAIVGYEMNEIWYESFSFIAASVSHSQRLRSSFMLKSHKPTVFSRFMVYCIQSLFGTFFHKMSRSTTKSTKWHVRLAKTQISLGIRRVWSDSPPCASCVAKDQWWKGIITHSGIV